MLITIRVIVGYCYLTLFVLFQNVENQRRVSRPCDKYNVYRDYVRRKLQYCCIIRHITLQSKSINERGSGSVDLGGNRRSCRPNHR